MSSQPDQKSIKPALSDVAAIRACARLQIDEEYAEELQSMLGGIQSLTKSSSPTAAAR
jgi:hypothetical protein